MTEAMKHWLDCPCCGEEHLVREEPEWFEGEEERCPDCGAFK